MFKERLSKLRESIARAGLDSLMIMSESNRFYITGFHGSNGLVYVSHDKAVLVTDFRYLEQAEKQAPEFEIIRGGQEGLIAGLLEALGSGLDGKIGVEKVHLTIAQYDRMRDVLPETVELVPCEKLVEDIRKVKDPAEIKLIIEAQRISEKAFNDLLPMLRPDMTEKQAAIELEIMMKRNGSGPFKFEVIVGAGGNAALPHHTPDDTPLGTGRSIVIDFGAAWGWYTSDTTRTVFLGSVSDEMRTIYEIVREAQQMAVEALKAGKTGVDIDTVAREFINSHGHTEHFGHGLGHGVGIDVHEAPTLAPKGEDPLEAYNIFSVEPGIYLPGVGGVRIEDLCWIKPDGGYEDITLLPRELTVL